MVQRRFRVAQVEAVVSILELLGFKSPNGRGTDDPALRAIVGRLEGLPHERALLVAAFAAALVRAARADLEVTAEETERMVDIVRDFGGLSAEDAGLVVEMATHESLMRGAPQDYLATREFRRLASDEDRRRLLRCLFEVCAADGSISVEEEQELYQAASELGFSLREYTEVRSRYRDQREVLKGMPRSDGT
jgi:tellurite resistance protein